MTESDRKRARAAELLQCGISAAPSHRPPSKPFVWRCSSIAQYSGKPSHCGGARTLDYQSL